MSPLAQEKCRQQLKLTCIGSLPHGAEGGRVRDILIGTIDVYFLFLFQFCMRHIQEEFVFFFNFFGHFDFHFLHQS